MMKLPNEQETLARALARKTQTGVAAARARVAELARKDSALVPALQAEVAAMPDPQPETMCGQHWENQKANSKQPAAATEPAATESPAEPAGD